MLNSIAKKNIKIKKNIPNSNISNNDLNSKEEREYQRQKI